AITPPSLQNTSAWRCRGGPVHRPRWLAKGRDGTTLVFGSTMSGRESGGAATDPRPGTDRPTCPPAQRLDQASGTSAAARPPAASGTMVILGTGRADTGGHPWASTRRHPDAG